MTDPVIKQVSTQPGQGPSLPPEQPGSWLGRMCTAIGNGCKSIGNGLKSFFVTIYHIFARTRPEAPKEGAKPPPLDNISEKAPPTAAAVEKTASTVLPPSSPRASSSLKTDDTGEAKKPITFGTRSSVEMPPSKKVDLEGLEHEKAYNETPQTTEPKVTTEEVVYSEPEHEKAIEPQRTEEPADTETTEPLIHKATVSNTFETVANTKDTEGVTIHDVTGTMEKALSTYKSAIEKLNSIENKSDSGQNKLILLENKYNLINKEIENLHGNERVSKLADIYDEIDDDYEGGISKWSADVEAECLLSTEDTLGSGLTNVGNSCYINSLIQSLRQSISFKETLKSKLTTELITIPNSIVGHIQEHQIQINVIKNKKNNTYQVDKEEFAKLINLIEKKQIPPHKDLSIVLEIPGKYNFAKQLYEIISFIDSGQEIEPEKLENFRLLTRSLGWKQDEHITAQQDSQEFLGFIFQNILEIPTFDYIPIQSHDLQIDPPQYQSKITPAYYIPLDVPKGVTSLDFASLLKDNPRQEALEPFRYLYGTLVNGDLYKNIKTQDELDNSKVGNELEKLKNSLKSNPKFNLENDPTYQLLSKFENLTNITLEEWNKIKKGANLINYEMNLIDLFKNLEKELVDSLKHDQPFDFQKRRIDNMVAYARSADVSLDNDYFYHSVQKLWDDIRKPGVSHFFSTSPLDSLSRNIKSGGVSSKDLERHYQNTNTAIKTTYFNIVSSKDSPEKGKLLEILSNSMIDKNELLFNIDAVVKNLEELTLTDPELISLHADIMSEVNKYKKLLFCNENKEKITGTLHAIQDNISIKNPTMADMNTLKAMCTNFLKTYSAALEKSDIKIIEDLINAADEIPGIKSTLNEFHKEFNLLKEKRKLVEIDFTVKQTISVPATNVPTMLPFSINRFKGATQNIKTDINPSQTIEIPLSDNSGRVAKYNLKSIIVNTGQTTRGGHYFTYAPQENEQEWVEFNDNTVSTVDSSTNENQSLKTAQQQGYVYLYELEGIINKDEEPI